MRKISNIKKSVAASLIAIPVIVLLTASSCDTSKVAEPYDDAGVSQHLTGEAQVASMPDGFSNWADKCDNHGHRVFVAFHSDSPYAAITAISDPSCPGYVKGQP